MIIPCGELIHIQRTEFNTDIIEIIFSPLASFDHGSIVDQPFMVAGELEYELNYVAF